MGRVWVSSTDDAYAILTVMNRRQSAGYTILEVLLVLTISAMLFFSVITLLGGKQAKTAATQAVRDLETQIQNVASEVSSGFGPSTGQGVGTIFLGKVMNFRDDDGFILNVVGRQFRTGSTTDVANLAEARPTSIPAGAIFFEYNYGLEVLSIERLSDGSSVGSIGFLTQLGGASGSTSPVTGGKAVLLYGLPGSAPNTRDPGSVSGQIANVPNTQLFEIPEGVRICVDTGVNSRASITVGAGGSQTSTQVTIFEGGGGDC
jgi:type II secretory pathway pseudopilin PulG